MSNLEWEEDFWGKVDDRYKVELEPEDFTVVVKIYDTQRGDFLVDELSFDMDEIDDEEGMNRLEHNVLCMIDAYENDDYDVDNEEYELWLIEGEEDWL